MPYHLIEDANMCFDFWKLLSINKATTATTKEEEESISAQNYTLRVQERISIIRIILSPSAGRHAALLPVHKKGYGRLQPPIPLPIAIIMSHALSYNCGKPE